MLEYGGCAELREDVVRCVGLKCFEYLKHYKKES